MKNVYMTAVMLTTAISQLISQDCQNPVSAGVFQNNFNQIAVQPDNQKKQNKAIEFVNVNCLTAAQVKNIAVLFTEDSYRLEFCKAAYARTFDRVNFFDVYDAFTSFSSALRLYDFTQGGVKSAPKGSSVIVPASSSTNAPAEPVFPNMIYPSAAGYAGKKGCPGPALGEAEFMTIAKQVNLQPTDESKQLSIQNAFSQQCFTFTHAMKLTSMIKNEAVRYNALTQIFPRVFDLENYTAGAALFSSGLQQEWNKYAAGVISPPVTACSVNNDDYAAVVASIKAKSLPKDKVGVVDLVAKDLCFTVAQVKGISKEFVFPKDKLSVMKKLYANCPDKQYYYQLADELTFSSDKEALNTFIKNGGK